MFPIALQLQRDLRRLCDAGAATGAFPDVTDLRVRLGGAHPGRLIRLTRDLTHNPRLRNGAVNPHHLSGYAIPYVCQDTEDRYIMRQGITLETVLATIRDLKYTKTRGYNTTLLWDNVLNVVPQGTQRTNLRSYLHRAHAVFDPNVGDMAQMVTLMQRLPRALSVDERIYLNELVRRATA